MSQPDTQPLLQEIQQISTVNVLVAVDVQAALASGDLQNNVYMVDTNHFLGSYQEGSSELITTLAIGDTIVWTATPIARAARDELAGLGLDARVRAVERDLDASRD